DASGLRPSGPRARPVAGPPAPPGPLPPRGGRGGATLPRAGPLIRLAPTPRACGPRDLAPVRWRDPPLPPAPAAPRSRSAALARPLADAGVEGGEGEVGEE